MITIGQYEAGTTETAIYPGVGTGFYDALRYIGLGLAGEIGEISEKIKKAYRDEGGILTDEKRRALCDECGDVLWYLTRATVEHGLTLAEVLQANEPSDYFSNANFNWYEEDVTEEDMTTVLDWAAYYAGGMAEWNGAYSGNVRSFSYLNSTGHATHYLSCIAYNLNQLLITLGSSLDEAAQANHDKLFSRKERGVIGGSGDTR